MSHLPDAAACRAHSYPPLVDRHVTDQRCCSEQEVPATAGTIPSYGPITQSRINLGTPGVVGIMSRTTTVSVRPPGFGVTLTRPN